jgi:transposase
MQEVAMAHKQAGEAPRREHAKKARRPRPSLLERIQPDAAGVDCGERSHLVAVPVERDPEPVREFRTFTGELTRLADWLTQCRIKTVALESTGVYWIPLYEILEARGFEVVLVNARDVHNVPGRKSDVKDCQWLQELHSVGLLRASFRPAAAMVPLRSYVRQRQTLVEEASTRILRIQKALTQMNLMLHVVVTDLTGATGLAIIGAILAGQRDPELLAAHRDYRCHASHAEIAAALTGNYRAEHLFALKQNFDAYQFLLKQIAECDTAIEALLATLAAKQPQPQAALPTARRRRPPKNREPRFDIRTPLHRLTGGTDLSQIDSIGPHAALQLIAEIGTDMSRWKTAQHFTSWLALAPNNKISGGRLLSSKTAPSANRAAVVLRRCAMSLSRTSTALGAFYRRLAARVGKAKAITATARKLAVLVYRALCGRLVYKDPGAVRYHLINRTREIKSLRKRAKLLGLELLDPATGEVLNPVSTKKERRVDEQLKVYRLSSIRVGEAHAQLRSLSS